MLESSTRFFVLGCQRSGTTLLGLILDSHPLVDLVDEDDHEFHVQGPHTYLLDLRRVRRSPPPAGRRAVFKAPRDSHRVAEIVDAVDDPGFIWVRRAPEQVVASMCALRIEGDSWAVTHAPREIRNYLDASADDTAVRHFFSKALDDPRPRRRELLLATLCWIVKERSRREAQRLASNRIAVLEYAELVRSPEATTRQVCRFMSIEWDPRLLAHHRHHRGERIGGTSAQRPIDRSSLHTWKNSLSTEEVNLIRTTIDFFSSDVDPQLAAKPSE